jgi:hypothetical protein
MSTKRIVLPELYGIQAEISNDPHRFRVLDMGRRGGKTFFAMVEAFNMLVSAFEKNRKPARVWVVSPTFPMVREDWLQAEYILKDAITEKKVSEFTLKCDPFGMIEFKSAEREDEGLRGAGLDGCVVDEAARVSRKSWEQGLRPALADRLGRALFISTPKGRNYFYDLWVQGQKENSQIKSWKYPTNANPFFPKEEWDRILETTPELILKQEFLADFLEDDSSVFKNISGCLRGQLDDPKTGEYYTIGVDLARTEDFTVITVIRNKDCSVVDFIRFNNLDWSYQKEMIKSSARKWNDAYVWIDSTGVGDPIEEDLRKSGIKTKDYKFSNPSKEALVEQMMIAIEQKLISIPDHEKTKVLIDELKDFTYTLLPSGKIKYEAASGHHDDCVISLGLAIWGIKHLLYGIRQEHKNDIPRNSAVWLERKALENELAENSRLPRRYRRRISEHLSLS